MQKLTAAQVPVIVKQLVAKQGNKCAICGHHFTVRDGAVLDHDHDTGFIRGAIHRSCNQAEGKAKVVGQRGHKGVGSYEYLIGLGKYLEHHKVPRYNFIYPTHKTDDELRVIKNRKAREARAKRKQ